MIECMLQWMCTCSDVDVNILFFYTETFGNTKLFFLTCANLCHYTIVFFLCLVFPLLHKKTLSWPFCTFYVFNFFGWLHCTFLKSKLGKSWCTHLSLKDFSLKWSKRNEKKIFFIFSVFTFCRNHLNKWQLIAAKPWVQGDSARLITILLKCSNVFPVQINWKRMRILLTGVCFDLEVLRVFYEISLFRIFMN